MLTNDAIRHLQKPFTPDEHGTLQGNPYIFKSAIRERLSEVDPGWTNTPPELISVHGNVVVFCGGLTLCGDTRFAVGTGIFNSIRKDKKTGETFPIEGFELSREQAKAFKSAASDLLPRCAQEFGVGSYLKNMPRNQDGFNFHTWLNKLLAQYHWAYNGGGKRFADAMKEYDVSWEDIRRKFEPGRELRRLSDISLDEQGAMARLLEIIEEG